VGLNKSSEQKKSNVKAAFKPTPTRGFFSAARVFEISAESPTSFLFDLSMPLEHRHLQLGEYFSGGTGPGGRNLWRFSIGDRRGSDAHLFDKFRNLFLAVPVRKNVAKSERGGGGSGWR
jgi:hypothetical protein